MVKKLDNSILDQILALQITVAWAGEGACEPSRLGWWKTDLVDSEGGGDFMVRLLPKTARWASLEAVREAALRFDRKMRQKMADSDKARTLFFLGFEVDEMLNERMAFHKKSGVLPDAVLPLPMNIAAAFHKESLEAALGKSGASKYTVLPAGRQLKGAMPEDTTEAVNALAAALVPFPKEYPMPFYGVKG